MVRGLRISPVMGKTLIIAEKPSVANDISKALGKFQKHQDYFENDSSSSRRPSAICLTIVPPPGVEAAKGKWTFKNLPVIPPHFDLEPIERSANRLRVLKKLIKRDDVTELINACDAGREGELIFRNIVRHAKAKQPIKRLWLQSMTPASIREGFAHLRSDESMQPLSDAAISRSEADWLVGINGTRAMTAFNSKLGGFFKTTVGRVQTPTLAIVVEREAKIRKFVSRDFWEVIGTFDAAAGNYTGRWFNEKFSQSDDDEQLKSERIWDKAAAEAISAKCLGKPGVVTEESKPTTSMSPLLYDLTSLQRDANSRFGFSAKNTLGLAQALYERHKVLTYPRTDSRALPEDYIGTVKTTLGMLEGVTGYSVFADQILKSGWVHPNKRIFNNAKISDHFAIIPTSLAPKSLSEPEQKLYDMVTKRFLAIFYPAAEFLETLRITRVEGEPFKSAGKVLVSPGWLAVYGKESDSDETPSLAPVKPGETVKTSAIEVKDNVTKPPARYSEATLLSAMEGAGKLVDDDELREAMSEKGLGTPATRAAIIEGLIYEDYIHRNGRELQATAKAFSLMELLNGLGIPELTKPELTGDWEFQLQANPAQANQPGEIHVGHRRHDAAHCRARQEIRAGHDSRRLWRAEREVPEMRRRDSRAIQAVPVREMRFRGLENAVQPDVRAGGSREAHHGKADRPAARIPQQAGISVCRRAENERRAQDGIRFRQRPEQGRRGRRAGGFHRQGAARQMPEMRRASLRQRDELRLRKTGGRGEVLHVPHRQNHFAAGNFAGAGQETAGRGQDGFADEIHFQEKQPPVQGVSDFEGRQDGV